MMRVTIAVPWLLTGLAVAACAPATADWTRAGATAAMVDADWAACQALARDRADYGGGAIDMEMGAGRSGLASHDPLETYDRTRAADTYDRSLASCMRGKGYRRTNDSAE